MNGFTFHKHIKMSSLCVCVCGSVRGNVTKGYVKQKIERVRGREREKNYFVSECVIKLCVFQSKTQALPTFDFS